MSENVTVIIVQFVIGGFSILGVWYANRIQNARDEKKREIEAKNANEKEKTRRAELQQELETSMQEYTNRTFTKMEAKIEKQDAIIAGLKAELKKEQEDNGQKIRELNERVGELENELQKEKEARKKVEYENLRLRNENSRLKRGKGNSGRI